MLLILIGILILALYINSFNKRDKNLDYKLTPEYQKLGYDDKLRTDIIKGLEIIIKNEIISNYSNREFRTKAIENFIEARETYFYLNIESLSQQHKISHNATFDAIFSACNHVRFQFGIPVQAIQNPKKAQPQASLSDSVGLTKKQKLSCNIFLGYITNSSHTSNPSLWKLYNKVDRKQLELLGLSIEETTSYLGKVQQNFPAYKEVLKSLNDRQKDFLVSMAIDLLWCNGLPSEEEYTKFEKAFEKVVGIDKNDFSERILKINAIHDKFSSY